MTDLKNNQNVTPIIVDDGTVRVPIKNKFGVEIGHFDFNPTDINIIDRFNKISNEFENITKPLENLDISSDGTVDESDEDAWNAMQEAEKRLYEACDYMFGGEMSKAFFGKINPFSPSHGHFYCEKALNAVGNYISSQFDKEIKAIDNRVNKYTHNYRTGKHKDGGKKRSKNGKKR